MRQGGGKAKGSQFERDICKRLSLWVSGGQQKDLFWRSAMSGGRATVAMKRGENVRQAGDICSVAPEGHTLTDRYYIECKFYKDLSLIGFFLQDQGTLHSFWCGTVKKAQERDRMPFLIAKQNGQPALALFQLGDVPSLVRSRLSVRKVQTRSCDIWLLDDILGGPFKLRR